MIGTKSIASAFREKDIISVLMNNFAEIPLAAFTRSQTGKITVTF